MTFEFESDEKPARFVFLAESLMKQFHFATIQDNREIFCYNAETGLYEPAESMIEATIKQDKAFKDTSKALMGEVLYHIQTNTFVKRESFDKDLDIINVKNGLLNVRTGTFSPHTPEYLSLRQLPISYNPKATCPAIMKFLTSTLETEELKIVIRLLGYLLLRSSIYEKAFMLTGDGANGKSTFINLLVRFIGRENTTSISLQALTDNRFAKAELDRRMLNVFADLQAERIEDAGYFKTLVSGDRMTVERKHGQPFTMQNYAKLVFSANQIPETGDKSYAYYRRWVVIPFTHTFEGSARDERLLEKLTTEQELSGLLNMALVGLRRLEAEGGFEDTDLDEIRRKYELGASKIQGFFDACCILDPEAETSAMDLRMALHRYCKEKGTTFIDDRQLGKKLAEIGIDKARPRKKGKREYFYKGIGLKSMLESYNGPLGPMVRPTFHPENEIIKKNVDRTTGPSRPVLEAY